MSDYLKKRMDENAFNYRRTLDAIIEKYSKLKGHDGVEVDLQNMNMRAVESCLTISKKELSKLEPKLDYSHHNGGPDEYSDHSAYSTLEHDGASVNDNTHLTADLLNETQGNLPETASQAEDQDADLEKSLSSQGSSLLELYPSMISQIGKAWHRQHLSEAADSVLRRYRRLRWQSNRNHLNHTFNVSLAHTSSNLKTINGKSMLQKSPNGSLNMNFPRIPNERSETVPRSPLNIVTNMQGWQAERPSPGRKVDSGKKDQSRPILVMDFSYSSEISSDTDYSRLKEISPSQTFTVSQLSAFSSSQKRERLSSLAASPMGPCYPAIDASADPSLRSNRLPAHTVQRAFTVQKAGHPAYEMETSSVTESSSIHYSPARQGSFKMRLKTWEGHGRSPRALSGSPKSDSVGSSSREPKKPKFTSASPSSSLQKAAVSLRRRLYPQDSCSSSQPKHHSTLSCSAPGRPSFQRQLSYDSSFRRSSAPRSPMKLEDEFQKLYHRFVCQGKSSIANASPCHMCARSSHSSRSHSSSFLAALALSPHRSVLRKRHRELDQDRSPQSKRSRVWCCDYSPGSLRRGTKMPRRHPNTGSDNLPNSCSKAAVADVFSHRSTDAHQEGWMARVWRGSSSESSSLERRHVFGEQGGSVGKARWQGGSSSRRRLLNNEWTPSRKACAQHFPNYCLCTSVLENS